MVPLYSIGTWDIEQQAYTPPVGMENCVNITRSELKKRILALRGMGYSVHRRRGVDGDYDDNDWAVLIERTDGRDEEEISKDWER